MQDVVITLTGRTKKMKRSSTLATAFALVALTGMLSLTTSTWARSPRQGVDRMTRMEEKIDALNLDDATRSTIDQAINAGRLAQEDRRSQLHNAHRDLRAMLQQDSPDETAVLAQAEAIGKLETEHRKQTLRTLITIQSLLTPEQRASLRTAMRPHSIAKPGQER
jgi:Spy/CpxP family protein refolding chaperone